MAQLDEKIEKESDKYQERTGESRENLRVREAKAAKRENIADAKADIKYSKRTGRFNIKKARLKHGRGSDEVKDAKRTRKEDVKLAKMRKKEEKLQSKLDIKSARRDDMTGAHGGKEAKGIIGNIRKGINKRRTKRLEKKKGKLDAKMQSYKDEIGYE